MILVLMPAGIRSADIEEGPMLGEIASATAIMRWDIDIMPDGRGLPLGSGNVWQGQRGLC